MEGDLVVRTEVETTSRVVSEDVKKPAGSLASSYQRTRVRRARHEQPWNKYNRNMVQAKAPPVVSRPTKEEALKRRQWEDDRRTFQECQAKVQALKKEKQAQKKKVGGDEAATARRQAILERSRRWQEKHEKFSKEREMGNEQFRRLKERQEKLLYERFEDDFLMVGLEMVSRLPRLLRWTFKTDETEKRRQYCERLGRFRNLRPRDIIEEDALAKFKKEIGPVSDLSLRSQSTPGQRGPRSKKSARSRSTMPGRPPPGHISNTSKSSPSTNDQPVEEAGLKKTLDRSNKEKERLEAPPEVVEEADTIPNATVDAVEEKNITEDVAQEVAEDAIASAEES
ncbi:hypothetical protein BSKO_11600 [Bryopsis sp. KO-2023]|nr:hypothetical protein BSKO_11600 [Bryopsis sp. KO-2023]